LSSSSSSCSSSSSSPGGVGLRGGRVPPQEEEEDFGGVGQWGGQRSGRLRQQGKELVPVTSALGRLRPLQLGVGPRHHGPVTRLVMFTCMNWRELKPQKKRRGTLGAPARFSLIFKIKVLLLQKPEASGRGEV